MVKRKESHDLSFKLKAVKYAEETARRVQHGSIKLIPSEYSGTSIIRTAVCQLYLKCVQISEISDKTQYNTFLHFVLYSL